MLSVNSQPMLICKLCEMTAKQYLRFVDNIKNNQRQFELPKSNGIIKRTLPAILKNSKRKFLPENVVGMVGESTIIRLIPNEVVEKSLPSNIRPKPRAVDKHDEFEIKKGESSKTSALIDKKNSARSILCVNCMNCFADIRTLVKHFPFCITDYPICPICEYECIDYYALGDHYLFCYALNSFK